MPAVVLHETCSAILREYLEHPWAWLRENDLVVDVVSRLRTRIPGRVPAKLIGPGFATRLVDLGASPGHRMISRLRTEVKVARDLSDKTQLRCDVCILADREVSVVIYPEGARDVVLKVIEQDVAGLLEVKLYSDLYLDKDERCPWLDDLLKLSRIASGEVRGVLLVDTGLPLSAMGILYMCKRDEVTLARIPGALPPWPLPVSGPFEARPFNPETGRTALVRFEPVQTPEGPGTYLWALGLVDGSAWRGEFDEASSRCRPIPEADVLPTCWRVTVDYP